MRILLMVTLISVLMADTTEGQWAPAPFPSYDRGIQNDQLNINPRFWAPFRQQSCDQSRTLGREEADTYHSGAVWFLLGMGSGAVLSLPGAATLTGVSAIFAPKPVLIPTGVNETCFRRGYGGKGRSKNVINALAGGLIGTLAWVGLVIANPAY